MQDKGGWLCSNDVNVILQLLREGISDINTVNQEVVGQAGSEIWMAIHGVRTMIVKIKVDLSTALYSI